MDKPAHLRLSILELSKILMYEFQYHYLKPKYREKAKLCSIDTENFLVQIKTDDIYEDLAEDVETRFDPSNYELGRPLPKGKSKKVIGLIKDELGRNMMKQFVGLRAKTYSYLKDDGSEDKKAKATKKYVIRRKPKLENYENCLEATKRDNKMSYLEKNKLKQIVLKKILKS